VKRLLVLIATAVIAGVTTAVAGPAAYCTDATRACVIEAATTYLDALISHDAGSVRLHPDAWRMNNGRVAAEGADELRDAIRREPVARISGVRWLVDGLDAVAVYELEADLSRAVQSRTFLPDATWIPAYVIERFRVERGLITQIEVVYWGDPTLSPRPARPFRPEPFPPGPCADGSRACQVETAGAYLASFVSHDGSEVPLAPDAWRLENGDNTGDSGEAIRDGLNSPIHRVITAVDDLRWFVEGDQAIAFYTLYSDASGIVGDPITPEPLLTATYVAERFRIQAGLLKEIEAVFWIDPPPLRPDPRPAPS
jgi:hypothetical protein